jgi:hypothetical protein
MDFRWVGYLNPFRKPNWLEGLEEAEIEAQTYTWSTASVKALHAGMILSQFVFFGIVFTALGMEGVETGQVRLASMVDIIKTVKVNELPGIVIATWLAALFFKYLAEFLTRATVQILGFSISLQPGQQIRGAVYGWGTKIALFVEAMPFIVVYLMMWKSGVGGLLGFLVPRFYILFPRHIWWALGAGHLMAFVLFPAMRMRVQDDEELFQLLAAGRIRQWFQLTAGLNKKMVRLAVPHLSTQLALDVRKRGPEALGDWLLVAPRQWDKLREMFGLDQSILNGARQLRVGQFPDGRNGAYISRGRKGDELIELGDAPTGTTKSPQN